jgi:hypothetical protein
MQSIKIPSSTSRLVDKKSKNKKDKTEDTYSGHTITVIRDSDVLLLLLLLLLLSSGSLAQESSLQSSCEGHAKDIPRVVVVAVVALFALFALRATSSTTACSCFSYFCCCSVFSFSSPGCCTSSCTCSSGNSSSILWSHTDIWREGGIALRAGRGVVGYNGVIKDPIKQGTCFLLLLLREECTRWSGYTHSSAAPSIAWFVLRGGFALLLVRSNRLW